MLQVCQLGCQPYEPVLQMQREAQRLRQHGEIPDRLILTEHEPVITLGRRAASGNILVDAATLAAAGVHVQEIERGGDVTFHGPGQLVGYPIIHLKDRHIAGPREYVRMLEDVLVRVLAQYDIKGCRREGFTGVWTDRGKIAAIGVYLSRYVTMHGFALNVKTDLSYFDLIVPCGLSDRRIASINHWVDGEVQLPDVESRVITAFQQVFEYKQVVRLSDCKIPS